ncbi:amidohydrolase family protein [Streptomyces sp. NPDC059862]|uniref:amidohydrolase family protein n=1 Tax=Streptomyces sp. NPDC059862 TaxID=3346975 RepID=UPI0036570D41
MLQRGPRPLPEHQLGPVARRRHRPLHRPPHGRAPRVVAAYRELVRRPMAEYLRSVYYDVAVADSLVQVNTMVDTVGTDMMLFGTDWPYSDGVFDREQAGEHDLTRLLGPNLGAHVAGTNALRILPPHRTPGRQRKLS